MKVYENEVFFGQTFVSEKSTVVSVKYEQIHCKKSMAILTITEIH